LLFNTIYESGQIGRADIARVTWLTRPTVSDVVSDLMEQALVEEVGYRPSTGGRRPILLRVVDDARHLIGMDLARRGFRGAVINLRGKVRHRVDGEMVRRCLPAVVEVQRSQAGKEVLYRKQVCWARGRADPGFGQSKFQIKNEAKGEIK
jgi:hypothetical protein